MKVIKLSDGSELLLVFDGFGGSPERAEALRGVGNGALWYVYDYTDESFPGSGLDRFESVSLTAWSLGVYEAARTLAGVALRSATAVNGTLRPVDAECGIDPAVFEATAANWSDVARRKFNRRAGIPEVFGSRRPPEQEKAELEAILRRVAANSEPANIFKRAVTGRLDRVFTPENQLRFWRGTAAEVIEEDIPHYPWDMEKRGELWTSC